MGSLFGLLAALCFGTADFAATRAARSVGVMRTLLAVQLVGVLAMMPTALIAGGPPPPPQPAWLAMIAISGLNFAGVVLLYRAFAIGTLALVSPIASGFAVVTAVLAIAAGERPPGLALIGSALLIAGVILASVVRGSSGASRAGVPEALGVSLLFGIYYWALGEVTPDLGVFWPVVVTRVVQLLLAVMVLQVRGRGTAPALRPVIPFFVAAGLLDTAALTAYNVGVDRFFTTTTVALTSLYSVVTIVLAWIILRERLAWIQILGIMILLSGVLLVSL